MERPLKILLLFCALLLTNVSPLSAAPAERRLADPVTTVPDGKRGTVNCGMVDGRSRYVVLSNGAYISGAQAVKELAKKLEKARAAKRGSLQRKLESLKKRVKKNDKLCRDASYPTPTPTATPTFGAPSGSLVKLARPLTRAEVQYLLDKAGLGLSSAEEALVSVGVDHGVTALVEEFMRTHSEDADLLPRVDDLLDASIGSSTTQTPSGQRMALLDLWVHTNNPYAEKLALFLLSTWTVAGDVIEDETFRGAFWDYYTRLREAAYGDTALPDLGVAITRDPLMLIYLNNELNTKGNPNENYARELMELFTLGPTDMDGNPNYTETLPDGSGDIAVAAKLLTGWQVQKNYTINKLVTKYTAKRHEPGPHTMFAGKPYAFSGESDEDLVRGIFARHPMVAQYYAREILKVYVTPNPPRELVDNFALVIAGHGFRLRPAMAILLQSEAFFDPNYRDSVPMNSFEFAAKSARLLELRGAINVSEGQQQIAKMGFQLNQAPSVFWYPQDSWIGASVALEKANYLAQILGDSTSQRKPEPDWLPSKILPVGAISATQLIDSAQTRLGIVNLSTQALSNLDGYLKTKRQWNGTYASFTYDNTRSSHQREKGLGIYYLLLMSAPFQLL